MKRSAICNSLLGAAFLFVPIACASHPGIGIVCDKHGNIYYTDLKQVWKITPGGGRTVVVPGVHTHELSIDTDDNIYGEHLWYNGERLDTWGHYVWKLTKTGVVEKIKEATPGFLDDYGFLRDNSGNVYWIERFSESKFRKRSPNGTISTIAHGKFGDIRWSYCTANGIIYFVDLDKLYRLTQDGKFTLLAEKLDDGKQGLGFTRKHNVFGIWTDKLDNIYVAVFSEKQVKRIGPDGKVEVVDYSPGLWGPTGGVFDREGNLWVLEWSDMGQVRARKAGKMEQLIALPNFPQPVYMNYSLVAGGFTVLVLCLMGIRKILRSIFHRKTSVT
jgi:sugar lactone lactonase YvrE